MFKKLDAGGKSGRKLFLPNWLLPPFHDLVMEEAVIRTITVGWLIAGIGASCAYHSDSSKQPRGTAAKSAVPADNLLKRLVNLDADDPHAQEKRISWDDAGNVKGINLWALPVSENDINEISTLQQLVRLKLSPSAISLDPLSRLRHLKELNLSKQRMGPHYLAWLNASSPIEILDLASCKGVAENLSDVAKLPALKLLSLSESDVNDYSLKALTGMKSLEILFLNGTDVTDASVEVLASMPHLKEVTLFGTPFTQTAADQLRGANKNLAVSADWIHCADATQR